MIGKVENGKFMSPPVNDKNTLNVYKNLEWLHEHGFHELTQEEIASITPPKKEILFSKLAIMRLLGDAWPVWEKKIDEAGMTGYWNACTYLSTADEDFKPFWNKLSKDEKQLLLKNCRY